MPLRGPCNWLYWLQLLHSHACQGVQCLAVYPTQQKSRCRSCLLCTCRAGLLLAAYHRTMPGPYTLWHMLHRLRAAAPQLEVHLFRAAADKLLCSSDSSSRGPYDHSKGRHATMHADSVAHISAYVSEVCGQVRQSRC